MTAKFCALLATIVILSGCGGGGSAGGATPRAGCQSGTLPVGHWIGEWQTYALGNPGLARAGTVDVVIAASGKLSGSSTESDNPDLGTLSGTVKATGEFSVDSVVMRSGHEAKYKLSGTIACEGDALAGAGTSTWGGSDKGSLKLRLTRAE